MFEGGERMHTYFTGGGTHPSVQTEGSSGECVGLIRLFYTSHMTLIVATSVGGRLQPTIDNHDVATAWLLDPRAFLRACASDLSATNGAPC